MAATVNDLYTTLKNTSGVTRVFGFIPPHGKKLTSAQEYTVFGDIRAQMGVGGFGGGRLNQRKRKALETALLAGAITILKTPAAIVLDSAPAVLANPTVAVTYDNTAAGSTTALADGTYKVAYTFVNHNGETTIGTSEASLVIATAGGHNLPQITLPSLPTGALSMNIYLSQAGGAAGTEKLYATGVTTTTFNVLLATYNGGTYANSVAKPAANTTGFDVKALVVKGGSPGVLDPSWGGYAE